MARVEAHSGDLEGGYTVDFVCFRPDMDHTPLLKGLPDDRFQCPHWGYVQEGRLTYRFADHNETVHAGGRFLPSTRAHRVILQISPTEELRQVQAVIMRNV